MFHPVSTILSPHELTNLMWSYYKLHRVFLFSIVVASPFAPLTSYVLIYTKTHDDKSYFFCTYCIMYCLNIFEVELVFLFLAAIIRL
jgi:hypothetical protein